MNEDHMVVGVRRMVSSPKDGVLSKIGDQSHQQDLGLSLQKSRCSRRSSMFGLHLGVG